MARPWLRRPWPGLSPRLLPPAEPAPPFGCCLSVSCLAMSRRLCSGGEGSWPPGWERAEPSLGVGYAAGALLCWPARPPLAWALAPPSPGKTASGGQDCSAQWGGDGRFLSFQPHLCDPEKLN